MSEESERNAKVIADFRANGGKAGGERGDTPLILVHHVGRKSGQKYVSPVLYLAHDSDPDVVYIFASKGGTPTHPDWYHNLAEAGDATVELRGETYRVAIRELAGEERDTVYAEQARRFPNFAEYATLTAGVRTIPVLELSRA